MSAENSSQDAERVRQSLHQLTQIMHRMTELARRNGEKGEGIDDDDDDIDLDVDVGTMGDGARLRSIAKASATPLVGQATTESAAPVRDAAARRMKRFEKLRAAARSQLKASEAILSQYNKTRTINMGLPVREQMLWQRLRHDHVVLQRQFEEMSSALMMTSHQEMYGSSPDDGVFSGGMGSSSAAGSASTGPGLSASVARLFSSKATATGAGLDQVQEERVPLLEELEAERRQEIMEIERDMKHLSDIYRELGTTVQQQQEQLDGVSAQAADADANVYRAASELKKASKWQSMGLPLVGAVVGGLVAGPVGFAAGAKGALLAGSFAGGAGLGAVVGGRMRALKNNVVNRMELSRPGEYEQKKTK